MYHGKLYPKLSCAGNNNKDNNNNNNNKCNNDNNKMCLCADRQMDRQR